MRGKLLGLGILALLSAGAVTAAHAAPTTIPLGPNLSVTGDTASIFKSATLCDLHGSESIDASATNPGVLVTPTTPDCTGVGTFNDSVSFDFTALNGYQIDDLSLALDCGVTGGDSATVTFGSLSVSCPSGAPTAVSQEVTFPPVTTLSGVPLTISGTTVEGGSLIVDGGSFHVSLVAVPEPAEWALMLVGLGAVGAALRIGRKAAGLAAYA